MLQEFNLEIKDKKGTENLVADHLSRISNLKEEVSPIMEKFPDEKIFSIKSTKIPWYANFVNYLVSNILPLELSYQQKKKILF